MATTPKKYLPPPKPPAGPAGTPTPRSSSGGTRRFVDAILDGFEDEEDRALAQAIHDRRVRDQHAITAKDLVEMVRDAGWNPPNEVGRKLLARDTEIFELEETNAELRDRVKKQNDYLDEQGQKLIEAQDEIKRLKLQIGGPVPAVPATRWPPIPTTTRPSTGGGYPMPNTTGPVWSSGKTTSGANPYAAAPAAPPPPPAPPFRYVPDKSDVVNPYADEDIEFVKRYHRKTQAADDQARGRIERRPLPDGTFGMSYNANDDIFKNEATLRAAIEKVKKW